jgi:hypothetical protein
MIPIVIAVAYLLTVGGFLYLIAAILGEARVERDQISNYYAELLIQNELQAQEERQAGIAERNVLLERIQRPEYVPPSPVQNEPVFNDEITDDLHLVGTIKDDSNPPPPDAA